MHFWQGYCNNSYFSKQRNNEPHRACVVYAKLVEGNVQKVTEIVRFISIDVLYESILVSNQFLPLRILFQYLLFVYISL